MHISAQHQQGVYLRKVLLVRTPFKVQQRIQSWEKLISTETKVHSITGARSKLKTSPNGRKCTHGAAKRGLASPLAAAGNFQNKKKLKHSPSAAAGIVQERKKHKRKPKVLQIIVTTNQADIPAACILNPGNRSAGDAGDAERSEAQGAEGFVTMALLYLGVTPGLNQAQYFHMCKHVCHG